MNYQQKKYISFMDHQQKEYISFIEGCKAFGGKYRKDRYSVIFPHLGLEVSMSGNETKFYFTFGAPFDVPVDVNWGRLWSAADALEAVRLIDEIANMIGNESMGMED